MGAALQFRPPACGARLRWDGDCPYVGSDIWLSGNRSCNAGLGKRGEIGMVQTAKCGGRGVARKEAAGAVVGRSVFGAGTHEHLLPRRLLYHRLFARRRRLRRRDVGRCVCQSSGKKSRCAKSQEVLTKVREEKDVQCLAPSQTLARMHALLPS